MSNGKELEKKVGQSSDIRVDPVFTVRIGDQTHRWTYQQAFARAHLLITQKDYASAETILKELIEFKGRGPRAHILLAICKAGQSDYKGSRSVLDSAFQDDDTSLLAVELQDVIVNARMGFKDDAMEELVQLVNEHKEYPTLCLWLGDMLQASDKLEKAKQCFKLAIKRDRPGGAVALAAHQQLRKLAS
jgi:uncharacterized protein HemY